MMVGWAEWVALPEIGIGGLRAKIDTGAKTSALHAENIVVSDGLVHFKTSPDPTNPERNIDCRAPIVDQRQITNSGGQSDMRYVIETQLVIGDMQRVIEVTLKDRSRMRFRMLLGRQAFAPGMTIDPTAKYLQRVLSYF